jgi:hypothetical protein
MRELERLRADLHACVKAACLAEASRLAGEQANLALPTEATVEEFSRWISTSAAPVANAHLAIHAGRSPSAHRVSSRHPTCRAG